MPLGRWQKADGIVSRLRTRLLQESGVWVREAELCLAVRHEVRPEIKTRAALRWGAKPESDISLRMERGLVIVVRDMLRIMRGVERRRAQKDCLWEYRLASGIPGGGSAAAGWRKSRADAVCVGGELGWL